MEQSTIRFKLVHGFPLHFNKLQADNVHNLNNIALKHLNSSYISTRPLHINSHTSNMKRLSYWYSKKNFFWNTFCTYWIYAQQFLHKGISREFYTILSIENKINVCKSQGFTRWEDVPSGTNRWKELETF